MIKRYFENRAAFVFSLIVGMLFVFFCKTEIELAEAGDIIWSGAYTGVTLVISVLGGVLLGTVSFIRLSRLSELLPGPVTEPETADTKVFAPAFIVLVLVRIPGWLAYWPGIAAYDSPMQIGQALGSGYNEHHPLAHTLLIKGCLMIGNALFGDNNAGIAVYTLLQILLISGAMAFGIAVIRKCISGPRGAVLSALAMVLFAFSPFGLYLDISVTKDVIYTAFFMIAVFSLGMILKGYGDTIYHVLLFVGVLGSILFRNNGLIAWAAAWAVMFIVLAVKRFKCSWRRLVVEIGAALILGWIILSLLFSGLGAVQGDRREMLSVPIQQIARTALYHSEELMPEDMAVVNEFLLDDSYLEYQPSLSDPVKRHTNTYEVRYRTGEFVRTYLHLFKEYPGDYINAVLALNAGYLYPGDESHAFINMKEGDRGLGYIQTKMSAELEGTGIHYAPVLSSLRRVMDGWADDNAYLNIPVLRYIFMPGIYVWLYALLILWVLIRRQWEDLLTLLSPAAYYGTLLLGPGVQLRYIYPLMVILPIITCVIVRKRDDRA